MTALSIFLILASVASQVGGQIFFKFAMNRTHHIGRSRTASLFAAGVASMGFSFLLWVGLLSRFQLSQLFPFEGVERVMMAAAAVIFLREKMTSRLLLGVVLICAGIMFVSSS